MASPSQTKLERQVVRAAKAAFAARRFVTAIDVLVGVGWLAPPLVEDCRRGRIDSLERVVGASLHRISTAMHCLRHWADQRGLNPSETIYVASTRDRNLLRFSKTGDPNIECAYRTHWVSPELCEEKRPRVSEKHSKLPKHRASRLGAGDSRRPSRRPQPSHRKR